MHARRQDHTNGRRTGRDITPARIAAIDIGSNSIRGVIADVAADRTYTLLADERFQTRLAADIAETGALSEERMEDSLAALEHLLLMAGEHDVSLVRAVATEAVRQARNSDDFIARARTRLALDIEIIDGETEGCFAFLSARANFELPNRVCIFDIGGGSLELVQVVRDRVKQVRSLPLGAVRLLAALPDAEDPPSPATLDGLADRVRHELAAALGPRVRPVPTLIGSGGTVTSLVGVTVAARGGDPLAIQGQSISAAECHDAWASLAALPREERMDVPGLAPYRADTCVPGGVVVCELMRLLDAENLFANQRGLREGILLDTIARLGRRR